MEQRSSSSKPLYPKIIDSGPDPFLSNPNPSHPSLYPSLHQNPNPSPSPSPSPNLYPSLDMKELAENLFPDSGEDSAPSSDQRPPPVEETLVRIPGAILHLIDKQSSVELASGEFSVARIRQAENTVAVLARIGGVQWPLARDETAVKLDGSHYFFILHDPSEASKSDENLLNYGLTFSVKVQEELIKELDSILESSSSFSVERVEREIEKAVVGPEEARAAAYWTTLAPNVEDYSGLVARGIAMGSGRVIQGILWCGDVTVERLKWGEDFMKRRMDPKGKKSEVSKDALKRMKRFGLCFSVFRFCAIRHLD